MLERVVHTSNIPTATTIINQFIFAYLDRGPKDTHDVYRYPKVQLNITKLQETDKTGRAVAITIYQPETGQQLPAICIDNPISL